MEMQFSVMLPYSEIVREAPVLGEDGFDVEVEIQDAHWLLTTCEMSSVRRVGDFLSERNIKVSVNGPIFDLNPGSLDEFIREHTKKVFLKTIELAASIGSSRVILPSGFSPFLAGDAREGWRLLAVEVWESCLNTASENDITVCIENGYEDSPAMIVEMAHELDNRLFGVCLDVGHINLYSRKKPGYWIKETGEYIREIHLNDNDGKTDDHLALGEGTVDIPAIFRTLYKQKIWPSLVFDMSTDQAEKSFKYLEGKGLLSFQPELL
jgi:sugar phosphate isomerase/epimerase